MSGPPILVEDGRKGMTPEALRRAVLDHLQYTRAKDRHSATLVDLYHALSHTVRDRLVYRWMQTARIYQEQDVKRIYYLSAEYLLGRQLLANLQNLGLVDLTREGLSDYAIELEQILEQEPDPGLGNGGLGRLAACFMDSLATLQLPAIGYGIRYEFGIFRQEIQDGWQVEQPDEWLRHGNPWEIVRPEYKVPVRFGGTTEKWTDGYGRERVRWTGGHEVFGVPHDTPVAGFGNNTVNTLRLWSARASEQFDLTVFNDGDYRRAVEEKALTESISKVLYPKDDSPEGKELRLKQQYFFVACSIHDMVRRYLEQHANFDSFADKVSIQLNDTHPAIAVAELMRVLVDLKGLPWEQAWEITQKTINYTNHTLLPEALEKWPLPLFEELLPRHLKIIYRINHEFLQTIHLWAPQDPDRKRRMSIIEEGPTKQIRMAHLSVIGSHKVNGVAELHSQLLKERVLTDFAELWPDRFTNKTNGVTPRRWLLQCNPRLASAITRRIGNAWTTDLAQLERLMRWADDEEWLEELKAIKQANKLSLTRYLRRELDEEIDPNSLFDVQVKRIHEYKRQAMCALHAVHLYCRAKFRSEDIVPRTVFFGGKAAPGYARAKRTIKLINDAAHMINSDPDMRGKLKVLFLPNYNVSMAERVIPAADISEQISMAGMEASGTGNMKFQMNGALTVGTLDGANIEIREEVGAENFFLFGLDAEEVVQVRDQGYRPSDWIERSEALSEVLELIRDGFFSPENPTLHHRALRYLEQDDPYFVCADFEGYRQIQDKAAETWRGGDRWWPMVARNIAHSGKFSSDRTIAEYAEEIWGLKPCRITLKDSD